MALIVLFTLLYIAIGWHELGHYTFARAFGMGIQEYSIGVGPRLFGFRRGPTRYSWRLLPFGGYVDPANWTDCEDPEELAKLDPAERRMVKTKKGWFCNQPLEERLLMLFAGPLFNIIMALAIVSLVHPPGSTSSWATAFASAWNVDARSAVAGIELNQRTSVVDHLAGFHVALNKGPAYVLRIFASLNMGLAVLNLLPILPLDGGQIGWNILMYFYEGRKKGKTLLEARRKAFNFFIALSLIGLTLFIVGQFIV